MSPALSNLLQLPQVTCQYSWGSYPSRSKMTLWQEVSATNLKITSNILSKINVG